MSLLDPITLGRLHRFRTLKRGWWSLLILGGLLLLAAGAELVVNSRALIVRYEGRLFFPTYGDVHPGADFGEAYAYEANYRELQKRFRTEGRGNWVLLPPVPYNPYENSFAGGSFPPAAPSWAERHFLGTDTTGRDILARLVYGFRIAMVFSLTLVACTYFIGVAVGCAMGYFGGVLDLLGQRAIEIWSNIPFLYVVTIVASLVVPGLALLVGIMVLFSWTGMTYYMRTATYKEKARTYVAAAEVIGAGTARIIFRHILPNVLSTLITFAPFSIAGGITSLAALDFLGFGLPPPTPSWGELLKQGTDNLHAPWIVASVFCGLVFVLTLVTFIGEAIREAFDPRRFSYYE